MSVQKDEGKNAFKPQVYPKRARGQRRQNSDSRDRSFYNGRQRKDLDSHRIDEETVIEEQLIDKITVEMIVEIEADKISEENLVMTETDQEKEALHPEGMVIDAITVQIQEIGIG